MCAREEGERKQNKERFAWDVQLLGLMCCSVHIRALVKGQRAQSQTLTWRRRHMWAEETTHWHRLSLLPQASSSSGLQVYSRLESWCFTSTWLLYSIFHTQTTQAHTHNRVKLLQGSYRSFEILIPGDFTPMLWAAAVWISWGRPSSSHFNGGFCSHKHKTGRKIYSLCSIPLHFSTQRH